ncbi:MAG: shikimate dehydrogenase family protein [Pyrobaculum sp.]
MYFAVIGTNVRGKSASPAMHKASFSRLGVEAEYWAINVPREELGCFIQLARLNLKGFNITIPHKEAVLKFLDVVSSEARAVGAVNTVNVERNLLFGYNTDATALYLLAGPHMRGAEVLVIGAGGAARAALFAAIKAEASRILVMNRTPERARALVEEFREKFGREVAAARWGAPVKAQVAINATPIYDESVVDVRGVSLYVDFVYTPTPYTKMLREAREAGARVVDGVELLVEQGAQAEKIWLGVEPDRAAMREAVLRFLRL